MGEASHWLSSLLIMNAVRRWEERWELYSCNLGFCNRSRQSYEILVFVNGLVDFYICLLYVKDWQHYGATGSARKLGKKV